MSVRQAVGRAWHALGGGASAKAAFFAYLATTLIVTWPLGRGLGRDVAWDLGDSILNMWILSWDCEQLRSIFGGDFSRIATFFDANIFFPTRLTLAYSEHLIPQALQILPVYLVSGNPILCYNLLFLSTFVLSGLGMYLLVRELTGNSAAAFVAGLVFAFAPYRLPQSSHLQVLSSYWMPFVFYGVKRYTRTRRVLPLAGAALALVAQNLSCGYYLLYFMPFAVAFLLWEVWNQGLWRHRRTWLELAGAGLLVAGLTAPFLLPYAALRDEWRASRSSAEVARFSADVYSYATAFADQRVWGRTVQAFPKPEGELFPGFVPLLLASIGIVLWRRRDHARGGEPTTRTPLAKSRHLRALRFGAQGAPRWLIALLAAIAIGHGMVAALILVVRRITLDTGLFVLRIGNINQLLLRGGLAMALLLTLSPSARERSRAFMRDRGFFVIGLAAAFWLSLGPAPQSLGRPVEIAAPYRLLLDFVPGFDGVRVPARFAMVVAFMLAVLAGYGADAIARYRIGRRTLVALAAAFLLEATHVPFVVNGMTPLRDFNAPEARLYRPARAPAIYHEVARQPRETVVVELPIGQTDFDLRAMYYSTVHWRPVVNGYSGFSPPHYGLLASALSEVPRHPDLSLRALRASGSTHVIVHEGAFRNNEGVETSAVLRRSGAAEVFREGSDVLFLLPR